jgi:glycosyltransferase involved in cell wall biosynthesis
VSDVSATVVICTHDRAAVVGRAIEQALFEARAVDGEVLVVDNASTDETPTMLERLEKEHPSRLRTVREPELGLSAARNRGLAEARREIVAFLDDDAVPRPGWLASLCAPYAAPEVACVGGRIRLHFPTPPPTWVTPALHAALGAFEPGDEPRALHYGRADYPFGGNISFRAARVRAAGGFSTRVGLSGRRQLQHEETDLCYRLEQAGGEIRYAPGAIVDHWVLPERLTPAWFLARHWQGGQSAAVFVLRNRGLLRALWRVRWLYGQDLLVKPYVPREPVDPVRLARECRRQEALGYLLGLVQSLPQLRTLRREVALAGAS